jgi:tetratricopeptide (TPR) repeat protein
MRLSVMTVALLALASAATATPSKRPRIKLDVELSARVKPRPRPAETAAAAPLDADQIMRVEVLASPIHAEQEHILLALIKSTPDTEVDEKSELYFRLAELYAKQQRLFRLQAVERELKGDKAGAADAAHKEQAYLAKAATAYKALTSNPAYQNFKLMDLALFVFGYTLQTGNHPVEARAVYDKLLRNYPSSKYVAEAHLAFAEYYFEAGKLDDAEARYKLVLKSPKTNAYWYAMYKLGWVQLQRGRPEDALETFFQVVQGTAKDPARKVLTASAKKDFVRAYAEVGKVDKALVAFKRVDGANALAMYEQLAGSYRDAGKSDKAIYVYRDLMKLQPRHAHVCEWQYQVALATLALPGAKTSDKVGEIANLTKLYRVANSLPAADRQECHDNAAAMAGELARAYHSEYDKTLAIDAFTAASTLYAAYLATFPDAADAPMTRFYRADLLWLRAERETDARKKTQAWEDTAIAFGDVVRAGHLPDAQINDAAYAGPRAWLYAHESDPRARVTAERDDSGPPSPRPLPEREQHMIESFELYVTHTKNPPRDELAQMKFLEANVLRRFDHLTEAIPLFKELAATYPDLAAGQDAGLLLVDIYIRLNDEKALIALTDQLLGNKQLLEANADVENMLLKIKKTHARKGAEALERQAAGKHDFRLYVACGQAYLDIYNSDPVDADNDQILYNAGVCFEQGRSLDAAMTMFQTLQQYYGSSPLAAKGAARLGHTLGDLAKYADAAQQLEAYAKRYAGEPDAYDAMSDAVFYYKGTGNDTKAIENTRYVEQMWGKTKPTAAADAAFSLITIYEKRGDTAALIKYLREYIAKHAADGGRAHLVIAYSKLGEALMRASCPIDATYGACVKVARERAVAARKAKDTGPRLRCGEPSASKLTVVDRDPRLVNQARAAFAGAAKAFTGTVKDDPIARHFAANARFVESTLGFEAYLALKFPANLDFDPRRPAVAKQSLARFDRWLADKMAAAKRTNDELFAVLAYKDNASSIGAAARIGQLSQTFADAMFSAEIPATVRTGPFADDKTEAYCEALENHGTPLSETAIGAYKACLNKSTELGWFSDWSQLCERELGQIRPSEFPTTRERRGDSDRVAVVTAAEPPPRVD